MHSPAGDVLSAFAKISLEVEAGVRGVSAVPCPVPTAITLKIAIDPLDWLLAVASMFVASAIPMRTVHILHMNYNGVWALVQAAGRTTI